MLEDIIQYVNTDPFLLFFGSFFLIMGLSIFFAKKHWHDFIKLFIENDAVSLIMGIFVLPISLFIIVFYDNWDGLAPTILMVIGYIGFFKALMLLLKPDWMQSFLNKGFIQRFLWLDGLSGVLLGAAMLLL